MAYSGSLLRGARSGVRACAHAVSRARALIAMACSEDRFVCAARGTVSRKIASTKFCAKLARVRIPDTAAGHTVVQYAVAQHTDVGLLIRAGAGHSASTTTTTIAHQKPRPPHPTRQHKAHTHAPKTQSASARVKPHRTPNTRRTTHDTQPPLTSTPENTRQNWLAKPRDRQSRAHRRD
jgi:hypothetical protein